MSTATMPRKIGTLQYFRAALAVRLGLEPEHEGATPEWAELLRAGLTERPAISRAVEIPTAIIPPVRPVRRPVAALAARPHQEQVCPLDACPLDLGPLEPARLFDADRYARIGATA